MIMSSTQVILPSFEPIMITGSQYILLDKKKREYTKQAAEELGEWIQYFKISEGPNPNK